MFRQHSFIEDILFGVAVGDALGVPVEYKSRQILQREPVTDMIGFGTYSLPPGTWSDDSSLTFCLAEALIHDFDLQNIADNFVAWRYKNFWTARGEVFDVGIATHEAIEKLAKGEKPDLAGGFDIYSNGNGSLMRILPLVIFTKDKPIEERFEITKKVSSITHGHIHSIISCFYYLEFSRQILEQIDKFKIYENLKEKVTNFLISLSINPNEIAFFDNLLKQDIYKFDENKIKSSGYVLHTLEASIWCLLVTDNFKDAVLKAVNLGEDTDTTGAVTGGLAGLLYGYENIPKKWIDQIARRNDIKKLATKLLKKYT